MLSRRHICDRFIFLMLVTLFLAFNPISTLAQSTAFTYQGRLIDGGSPADGIYDLQFKLFDDLATPPGIQQGPTVEVPNVTVTNGIFTVQLDFGAGVFTGANRFLEIAVQPPGGGGFTLLSPRQPVTSNPYAVRSNTAAMADFATNTMQLGGLPASGFIQNTTSPPQAGTNFNIGGNGTVSGTLTGSVVNATTQFNIGGNRVLSVVGTNFFVGVGAGLSNTGSFNSFVGRNAGFFNTTGSNNSFVGNDAGFSNTTGSHNSFFGRGAGSNNTAGASNSFFGTDAGGDSTGSLNSFFGANAGLVNATTGNSFFGYSAGRNNTTGGNNSFFGTSAGLANILGSENSFFGRDAGLNSTGSNNTFLGRFAGGNNTTGSNNSFVGLTTGVSNTTGSNNTIVGILADVQAPDLNFATAIGAGSVVSSSNTVVLGRNLDTVQIPGNLNVAGNFTGSFTVPATNITGVLARANGGTGLSSSGASGNFLRSDGTNWTSSLLQASDIPSGSANYIQNLAIGQQSGSFNIDGGGTANIFNAATQYNIGGTRILGIGGSGGLFVGIGTGSSNTGSSNSFFGIYAGLNNTTGGANSFFGHETGVVNTTGDENAFFGASAGRSTSTGSNNSFFGISAGQSNTTGSNNTIIGRSANVGANNLSNATAIGANAVVSQSNSLVLGNNVNVGIGTSAPAARLHISASSTNAADNTAHLAAPNIGPNSSHIHFGSTGDWFIRSAASAGKVILQDSGGNVGIGTTAPEQKLHVDGNEILSTGADAGFKFRNRGSTSSADDWAWFSTSNVARFWRSGVGDLLTVTNSGDVTIGGAFTAGGVVTLNSVGSAGGLQLCRNAFNQISQCSSSMRYKTNIAPLDSGLQLINRLRPVTYDWKQNGEHDLGLVAEEVAKVGPLLVTHNERGEIEGVKYDRVGVVLVNAVQEQQRQIESQQKQLDEQRQFIKTQQELMQKQQSELEALKVLVCLQNPTAQTCKPKK